MKEDITFEIKMNELRMSISHMNNEGLAFIFVEGDSDILLFRKFFDLDNCKVERIPGGNPKVEDAVLELLEKNNLIIGIRDADFIHLSGVPYQKQNIFLTDFHDIEMVLVAENQIFNAILNEHTDISVQEYDATRNKMFALLEEISLLKWLSSKENLELMFTKAGFQDLIEFALKNNKNTINFENYFGRVLAESPNAKIKDINLIISKINSLKKENANNFQLCNGHDFTKTFAIFLREKGNKKSINNDSVIDLLRISYRFSDFKKTLLFAHTNEWANSMGCKIYK